ncbi:hypothetical protein AAEO56_06895 [Flavobacterium sp. DGU11]|uniref:Uncharacterized protein n=1 Tax=Flavobacterium arundinis TaxID=3139143 RepID=A0ABU9HW90_9FLAO
MTLNTVIIVGVILLAVIRYIVIRGLRVRATRKSGYQDIISNVQSRIAKSNGAAIEQFSLENLSRESSQSDSYNNADFVNKNCTSREDFIVNDTINEFDLKKLADLNGIQLQIQKGWYPILIELIVELDKKGWNREVSCIKEKFASLRFYSNTEHQDIIDKFERRSEHVCETCGKRGEIRYHSGWDYVACRKHYLENRGKITPGIDSFIHNGKTYSLDDIKDMHFEDKDHRDNYKFLIAEFYKNKVEHPGWKDNKLYISNNIIGFGNFLSHLPGNLPGIDYEYVKKFIDAGFCEVCGYEAVYNEECECCENSTWESYQRKWKNSREEKREHIVYNQIRWTLDEGEKYEALQKNYPKDPDYRILFTDEEFHEYNRDDE